MTKQEKLARLQDVRVRRRELKFKESESGETRTLRLPFGSGLNSEDYSFETNSVAPPNQKIFAINKNGSSTIVTPEYHSTDSVKDPQTGERIRIKLWVVYSDRDRLRSRQVIQRVHYLADSGRGLFLACAFADHEQQIALRKRMRKSRDSHFGADTEDVSWIMPPGGIIACAVLDTLWHGNPIAGRALIADALKIKGNHWKSWSRSEVVQNMRVAWASRFAVDNPYQGLGIGTVLARHLKKVARYHRAPAADFLEVITTTEKNRVTSAKARDFLQKAGYIKLSSDMKSSTLMIMNLNTGFNEPRTAAKHYYFADVRDE